MTDKPDPCATCGMPDILDGSDPAAHWTTRGSDVIAAWTCSEACSDKLEAQRDSEGRLRVRDPS